MQTIQKVIKEKDYGSADISELMKIKPQLGFIFGTVSAFENANLMGKLKSSTGTTWVGCTTAGEVSGQGVTDNTSILTTIHFDKPDAKFKTVLAKVTGGEDSEAAGKKLAQQLQSPDLRSVIVISPGVNVNGSLLVQGLRDTLGKEVIITGGLAGDGGKFEKTYTFSPEGVTTDQVVAVGFYGDAVQMRHGCMGGWDPFGKDRKVTKSKNNVVFELDGKPALEIYKEYLGEYAKDLPASGLMFPFSLANPANPEAGLIRTILAVDEKDGSLTFAGDVPQGATVRLMHANTKGLVSGAKTAAENVIKKGASNAAFAMIVSCVGRKLVMGPNVDEEIEAISETFGDECTLAGFYSYGEISPFLDGVGCELHNQTMTISYLTEV